MAKKIDFDKEFDRMKRQVMNLRSSFAKVPQKTSALRDEILFKTPATDIYENDTEIVATLEIPGVKKEDISLQVKDGVVSIKAENTSREEDTDEKRDYHRIERSYYGFMRSFTLPMDVDEKKVKAKYDNGVLEIRIPKKKMTVKNNDFVKID